MTVPQAIVIGAAIIAGAIIGAQIITPYRLASGTAIVWRLNAITGETVLCNFEINVRAADAGNRCH